MTNVMIELEDCKTKIRELEMELAQVKSERDGYFRKLEIVRKYLNTLQKQARRTTPAEKV